MSILVGEYTQKYTHYFPMKISESIVMIYAPSLYIVILKLLFI